MTQRSALQFAIQGARLIFFPLPVAIALATGVAFLASRLWHLDLIDTYAGEEGYYFDWAELFYPLFIIANLQAIIGVPSLILLDFKRSGVRRYLATAAAVAVILSLLLAAEEIRTPAPGETLGSVFVRVLLVLGVPLVLSYVLAFYLRRRHDQVV